MRARTPGKDALAPALNHPQPSASAQKSSGKIATIYPLEMSTRQSDSENQEVNGNKGLRNGRSAACRLVLSTDGFTPAVLSSAQDDQRPPGGCPRGLVGNRRGNTTGSDDLERGQE